MKCNCGSTWKEYLFWNFDLCFIYIQLYWLQALTATNTVLKFKISICGIWIGKSGKQNSFIFLLTNLKLFLYSTVNLLKVFSLSNLLLRRNLRGTQSIFLSGFMVRKWNHTGLNNFTASKWTLKSQYIPIYFFRRFNSLKYSYNL